MIKITPVEEIHVPEVASFTFVSATTLEASFPIQLAKPAVAAQQPDFTAEDFDQALKAASRRKTYEPES